MKWTLSLLVLLLFNNSQGQEGTSDVCLRFYYQANRQGELEPCGCATGQIGGLGRLKGFFDSQNFLASLERTIHLSSGDTFFEAPLVDERELGSQKQKAKLIARAYQAMKIEAMTPGEYDFAGGVEFLKDLQKEYELPLVSANIEDSQGRTLFPSYRIVKKGGQNIALIGLSDPKAYEGIKGIQVKEPKVALENVLKQLKKSADLIVLVSHLGLSLDKEIAKLGKVNLIFGAHSLDVLEKAIVVNNTSILQPYIGGQQIGIWDYYPLSPNKNKNYLVDLSEQYETPNEIFEWIKAHHEQQRKLAVNLKKELEKQKAPFVANPITCKQCHLKQYEFWKETHHASAYLVLYSKNQHFDSQCISCHSLGFKDPSGFSKIARPLLLKDPSKDEKKNPFIEQIMKKTFQSDNKKDALDSRTQPDRYKTLKNAYHKEVESLMKDGQIQKIYVDVQCEHCHGNRMDHPGNSVAKRGNVNKETCIQCHQPDRDPNFNFEKKKPLVACPRMESPG